MIISIQRIAIQAKQDAQDACNSHPVRCPYPDDSEAARVWTAAFTRHMHEALALEGCEASA